MPKPKMQFEFQEQPKVTNLDNPAKLADGSNRLAPPERMKLKNGRTIYLPALPFKWWLDDHGDIVPVALSTNREMENYDREYHNMIIEDRRALGWKPLEEISDAEYEKLVELGKIKAAEEMAEWWPLTAEGQRAMNEEQHRRLGQAVVDGLRGNKDALRAILDLNEEVKTTATAPAAATPAKPPTPAKPSKE